MSRRIRVAVLAGGRSSEHEISLASARSVLGALDPALYDVVTVAIGRDGRWAIDAAGLGELEQSLRELEEGGRAVVETLPLPTVGSTPAVLGSVDVVLPLLHGPFGEDGTVQGLLDLADIPYVGSGVAGSAVCMDKDLFKSVMQAKGIPVARHAVVREGEPVQNPFGYPVFVKPARLGSSIGISKVRAPEELEPAVVLALSHDDKVLVEEFVAGIEIEVGVLGNRRPTASLPGKVVSNYADWYDYASKYDEGGCDILIPPPELSQEQTERAQELAVRAFVSTECEGMARGDFFVRESDGEVVMNELNTIPGFTETSVYARLFDASGIPYRELLQRLIDLALERHERRSRLRY